MLQLILGENWIANRDEILRLLHTDIQHRQGHRILLVPEQISHDMERRLCALSGDETSRFAEVLSFTRLATRLAAQAGGIARQTLDAGGRLVAMAAAVEQLQPHLKAYAAAGGQPELLQALVQVVDELKSGCVNAKALQAAAKQTQGVLAQKLQELSLLLECYDMVCAGFGQDPRDRMTRLLEQLEETDFAETHWFYIDGFSDFTGQEMAILTHFIQHAPVVVISLTCSRSHIQATGMELAGDTARSLLELAKPAGVSTAIREIPDERGPTDLLRKHLLTGTAVPLPGLHSCAQAVRLSGVQEECVYIAASLRNYCAAGCRYRDLAVACSDLSRYGPVLARVLSQYHIPAYFAGTEGVLQKPVIAMALDALEAVVDGLDRDDVLRYLKSPLSPLTRPECDQLENYVIRWGVRGQAWGRDWTWHPQGLGVDWSQEDKAKLEELNACRRRAVEPLVHLKNGLQAAGNTKQQLQALYDFFQAVDLPRRMDQLAAYFDENGEARRAQEQEQLWEILMHAMDQLAELLGDTVRDAESFLRLLRQLLIQYSVGTIPPVLDSVLVGGIPAMRRTQAKHVFLLGAQEGLLPQIGGGGRVLTEQERQQLAGMGLPLHADQYRQLEQEMAGLYAVISGAEESLCMTCGGQPAFVFERLCRLLGRSGQDSVELSPMQRMPDAWETGALLARLGRRDYAEALALPEAVRSYEQVLERAGYTLGRLRPETVRALYGNQLKLSASQVDRLATCRFSYFLRYGLQAKERKEITVDPAEFGTFVHFVLERTARAVCNAGGFQKVSLERTEELALGYAKVYQDTYFSALGERSSRETYLFQRNLMELQAVVQELWEELCVGQFQPAGFEVEFGEHGQMPPVEIPGAEVPAQIRGFVDRIDLYQKEGETYLRVVDYKTGRKEFDYCDVLHGVGLQMLIYLYALELEGAQLLGAPPSPAGILYFPARVPVLPAEGRLDPETAKRLRQKESRRQGLLLQNSEVLQAMDPSGEPRFLPCKQGKQGELTGDLATAGQLRTLRSYVFDTLRHLVRDIAEGDVTPNPYVRGNHDACRYCPYASACSLELWGERRVRRAVKAKEFWAQVSREEDSHGK